MTAGPGTGPVAEGAEIAIVTITKNDPAGIRKTLRSVSDQDFGAYEHVVLDGGSPEGTVAELAAWHDADPRRHLLVAEPPAGIYPAMNAGIEATTAPLVLVLNGGDELLPGALRAVVDDHRVRGWRWAYGGIEGRDVEGHVLGRQDAAPFAVRRFRAGLQVVPHPSTYVTRKLYEEVGLYRTDLGTGADQEFFLRVSRVAEPALLPGFLSVFETGGVSSGEGLVAREVAWHRMRVASGTAFGGRPATDLLATGFLVARQGLAWAARKVRRRGGGA